MKHKVIRELADYKDMLYLPHHVSKQRPEMPRSNRAAQFAPFAAVVGYQSAVDEVARYTDQKKELDEMEKTVIDYHLRMIASELPRPKERKIVYFVPDPLKPGGSYMTKVGQVKKIDLYKGQVLMEDGATIPIDEIYHIGENTTDYL